MVSCKHCAIFVLVIRGVAGSERELGSSSRLHRWAYRADELAYRNWTGKVKSRQIGDVSWELREVQRLSLKQQVLLEIPVCVVKEE